MKMWSLNKGGLIIEVVSRTDLTVYLAWQSALLMAPVGWWESKYVHVR